MSVDLSVDSRREGSRSEATWYWKWSCARPLLPHQRRQGENRRGAETELNRGYEGASWRVASDGEKSKSKYETSYEKQVGEQVSMRRFSYLAGRRKRVCGRVRTL